MDGDWEGRGGQGHGLRFVVHLVVQLGSLSPTSDSAEILNGDGALLPLIKALGEFLTSEEDEQRRKGMLSGISL